MLGRFISKPLYLAVVGAALLSGCATRATLTINSQPEGAFIREIGTGLTLGTAPANIYYEPSVLNRHRDYGGCFKVKGIEATWPSGAVSRLDPIRLCGEDTGRYTITLNRDPALPGLDVDLNYSLRLQSTRAAQQAADAASTAAAAAALSASQARNADSSPSGSGFAPFVREYISGMNKICIYNRLGSDVAITIRAVALCPLTLPK